jgi:hypothetical protein
MPTEKLTPPGKRPSSSIFEPLISMIGWTLNSTPDAVTWEQASRQRVAIEFGVCHSTNEREVPADGRLEESFCMPDKQISGVQSHVSESTYAACKLAAVGGASQPFLWAPKSKLRALCGSGFGASSHLDCCCGCGAFAGRIGRFMLAVSADILVTWLQIELNRVLRGRRGGIRQQERKR